MGGCEPGRRADLTIGQTHSRERDLGSGTAMNSAASACPFTHVNCSDDDVLTVAARGSSVAVGRAALAPAQPGELGDAEKAAARVNVPPSGSLRWLRQRRCLPFSKEVNKDRKGICAI